MESDLGHKLMTLNSLWYPHYLAATGEYTMVGAETAQGTLRPGAKADLVLLDDDLVVHATYMGGELAWVRGP